MRKPTVLLATLVLLPLGAAGAQRARSAATKHEDAKFADDNMKKGPAIRGRDLEDLNPLKLLIDKRKDLKLSDAQIDGLKKAESALKEKNQPLYKAVDSIAREMRPPMNPTAESDAKIRDLRRDLEQTIASIQGTYDAASADASSGFDADQKTRAAELLAKLKGDSEKRIRERMQSGG